MLFCFGAKISLATGHVEHNTYDGIETHGNRTSLSFYGSGEPLTSLEDISSSGRYLVWKVVGKEEEVLVFQDTFTGSYQKLTDGDSLHATFDKKEQFVILKEDEDFSI
jgi:hypothetical protein